MESSLLESIEWVRVVPGDGGRRRRRRRCAASPGSHGHSLPSNHLWDNKKIFTLNNGYEEFLYKEIENQVYGKLMKTFQDYRNLIAYWIYIYL